MKVSELEHNDCSDFYKKYIATLGEVELLAVLKRQLNDFPDFLKNISKEKLQYAYAEEKWTVAEVVQHIIDTERVFQYRALCFSRNDQTPLPGFDQDTYVPESNANNKTIENLIEEYRSVRSSTVSLFTHFDSAVLKRSGFASNAPMSVGATGFIICGHLGHHNKILRERYF